MHAAKDPDPTFNSDADLDPDPDPTPSFTHVPTFYVVEL
jgi:hypothetical protein